VLLENKVALIAGNATEIGHATTIAMANAGAKVAIGDRNIEH
jgi:NAD(P)-dependent dehydrogenase (short-subunit alcohol dehydrogenase family)